MLMPMLNRSPECSHSLPDTLKEDSYICLIVSRTLNAFIIIGYIITTIERAYIIKLEYCPRRCPGATPLRNLLFDAIYFPLSMN